MTPTEAPAYSVAVLGSPDSEVVIVKTHGQVWRYVHTGRLVMREDFCRGWHIVSTPDDHKPESGVRSEDEAKLACLDRAKRDITGSVDGKVTMFDQDRIVELAERYVKVLFNN